MHRATSACHSSTEHRSAADPDAAEAAAGAGKTTTAMASTISEATNAGHRWRREGRPATDQPSGVVRKPADAAGGTAGWGCAAEGARGGTALGPPAGADPVARCWADGSPVGVVSR